MVERVTQIYNSSGGEIFSVGELEVVEKLLLENRSAFEYPPLCEYYRINASEIRLGVECPGCGVLGMLRTGKTWTCSSCRKRDRNAHKKAVDDYFWLINNKITNREFRRFCKVDSIYAASRMLSNMGLQTHRAGGKTYYTKE